MVQDMGCVLIGTWSKYRKLAALGCSFILVYLEPLMKVPKLNMQK